MVAFMPDAFAMRIAVVKSPAYRPCGIVVGIFGDVSDVPIIIDCAFSLYPLAIAQPITLYASKLLQDGEVFCWIMRVVKRTAAIGRRLQAEHEPLMDPVIWRVRVGRQYDLTP